LNTQMQSICLSQEPSLSTYPLHSLVYSGLTDQSSKSLTAIPLTTIAARLGGSTLAEV
jgi:hypothetical protein